MPSAIANSRIKKGFPKWRKTDWEVSTAPQDSVTGIEEDALTVDLGSAIAAGARGPQAGLTLDYKDNFDDSVWSDMFIWMANKPVPKLLAEVEMLFESASTFSAVSDITSIAGVNIPGDPYLRTLTGTALGAGSGGTDEYDPAANRIRAMVLQLVLSAGAPDWDVNKTVHEIPELRIQVPRTDYDAEDRIIDPDIPTGGEEAGHLFKFAEVELFLVEDGNWQRISGVKDNTISITETEAHASWRRGKPDTEIHRARQTIDASISFQFDQIVPSFLARANQTVAARNSVTQTIDWELNGESTTVLEDCFVVRCLTHGCFLIDYQIPRGVLSMDGDYTPGGDDFAGKTMTVTGLASGSRKTMCIKRISQTPVEISKIRLLWSQTV